MGNYDYIQYVNDAIPYFMECIINNKKPVCSPNTTIHLLREIYAKGYVSLEEYKNLQEKWGFHIKNTVGTKINWNVGVPMKENEYLVTLENGYVTHLMYYPTDCWINERGEEETRKVVAWSEKILGYEPLN